MWRRVQSKKGNSFQGDSGNDVMSIARSQTIGDMMLRIRVANGANHNIADGATAQTVVESISEIKLYAGSRLFKNYSAEAARALATYKTGLNPYFAYTQVEGGTYPAGYQEIYIPISFSRFPGDHQCALPAPLMPSLEMSVEYDFTLSADAGFATGTAKYDLFADVLPGLHTQSMQNLKIIEETKKQDRTTLASGDDKIDMTISPTKQLRQVMAMAYKQGEVEGGVISQVGLKVNQVEEYTDTWRGLQAQNAHDCRLNYEQILECKAATTTDEIWTRIPDVTPMLTRNMITTAGHEAPFVSASADAVTVTTEAADDLNTLLLKSKVIPQTVFIDLDRNMTMGDCLNMGVTDLDFTFTHAAADGGLKVYEQILATY